MIICTERGWYLDVFCRIISTLLTSQYRKNYKVHYHLLTSVFLSFRNKWMARISMSYRVEPDMRLFYLQYPAFWIFVLMKKAPRLRIKTLIFTTMTLPPGDNPIAVNKYVISYHAWKPPKSSCSWVSAKSQLSAADLLLSYSCNKIKFWWFGRLYCIIGTYLIKTTSPEVLKKCLLHEWNVCNICFRILKRVSLFAFVLIVLIQDNICSTCTVFAFSFNLYSLQFFFGGGGGFKVGFQERNPNLWHGSFGKYELDLGVALWPSSRNRLSRRWEGPCVCL
jgi:hypothetical protein